MITELLTHSHKQNKPISNSKTGKQENRKTGDSGAVEKTPFFFLSER
jgi:hypothetical protein